MRKSGHAGILIGGRRFGTLLAGAMEAPRLARAQRRAESAVFYSSVGPDLTLYHINVAACTLTRQGTAVMPANVQYAWRHPTQPVLYVASSKRRRGLGRRRRRHASRDGVAHRSGDGRPRAA